MTERLEILRRWVAERLGVEDFSLQPASEDASFRSYFRVQHDATSYIVMDAPPASEDSKPFIEVSRSFHALGLNVPEVLEVDSQRGFLLLTDLGSCLYLDALNEDTVERLYGDAMGALLVLQACGPVAGQLPAYDHRLLWDEMELFRDWFLKQLLGIELGTDQQQQLDKTFAKLAEMALLQPRACVHRDYHSRNLMVTEKNNPGILDFQDAVIGPITYDLVSLLRDCYIDWPRAKVQEWVLGYRELALQSGVLKDVEEQHFLRWFDWMGVQRHLKAAGIFARLNYRDGKPGFLKDIPRTVSYISEVTGRYEELAELHELVTMRVIPRLGEIRN